MKTNLILLLLCGGLVLLLAGCGAAHPDQTEEPGEPLDITAFSFYHTASFAGDCFALTLTREDTGIHLYAEELFSGGRIADTAIESDALERLGELAGTHHLLRWDGFDKNKKHASDGSSFTLSLTLSDGTAVSAHGNNAFPENYADVYAAIRALYDEVMEEHGLPT